MLQVTANRRIRKSILLTGATSLFALAMLGTAAEAQTRDRQFDIAAQPLSAALLEFSRQADQVVTAPSNLTSGRKAAAVRGQMAPDQALDRLLGGSGLRYRIGDNGQIMIVPLATRSQGAMNVEGLQLAQQTSDTQPVALPEPGAPAAEVFQEIVVTGTHIRGIGTSIGTDVLTIDRQEIDRSGFGTVQQVLQALPQNFQGGPSEDTFQGAAGSNITAGSGVNLRGLGTEATLVLVNGRRMPNVGVGGDFVDISTIPLNAIERVEVLPDGASAIYGADAVAGVVNIILRDKYDGAETRLRYGSVTNGGLDEILVGQSFGKSWDSGNVLVSYEYFNRDPLFHAERKFAADSDLRPLGGSNFSITQSNPGNILDPFTGQVAYAIPSGQDGTALTPGDLLPGVTNYQNRNVGLALLQDQERHSVYATANQWLNDDIKLFAEGRFSQRDFSRYVVGLPRTLVVPASNPFFVDPFGGMPFVLVNYNFIDDFGPQVTTGNVKSYSGTGGLTAALVSDWQLQAYASYTRDTSVTSGLRIDDAALDAALADPDPATAFNPFGDGSHTNPATLAGLIGDPTVNRLRGSVLAFNAIADGSLFDLPGGAVRAALGVDWRQEKLRSENSLAPVPSALDRTVKAAFAELFVPVVGAANAITGINRLSLSFAVRHEDYSDVGTTTNPKISGQWSLTEGFNLRGTWGKSFRAPNLPDLDRTTSSSFFFQTPDPASPSGVTRAIILAGGNPDLKNQTAQTWTIGVDIAPPTVPQLRLSATYFNIHYKDRISGTSGNILTLLFQEDIYGNRINRNPSADLIASLCSDPLLDTTFGDCSGGVETVIDGRLANQADARVKGMDVNLSYGFDLGSAGQLQAALNANYLFEHSQRATPTSDSIDLVGTMNNPIDFRMRNTLSWSHPSGVGATLFMNYYDSYKDTISIPERTIDAWTTFDLTLSYDTGDRPAMRWMRNTSLSLSVLNLFDKDPPFVNNPIGVGYDPENVDPLGRFISLSLTKRW